VLFDTKELSLFVYCLQRAPRCYRCP